MLGLLIERTQLSLVAPRTMTSASGRTEPRGRCAKDLVAVPELVVAGGLGHLDILRHLWFAKELGGGALVTIA